MCPRSTVTTKPLVIVRVVGRGGGRRKPRPLCREKNAFPSPDKTLPQVYSYRNSILLCVMRTRLRKFACAGRFVHRRWPAQHLTTFLFPCHARAQTTPVHHYTSTKLLIVGMPKLVDVAQYLTDSCTARHAWNSAGLYWCDSSTAVPVLLQ